MTVLLAVLAIFLLISVGVLIGFVLCSLLTANDRSAR